ncbi:MAG: glycosyltransferase family 39 protein [candidate division Zixibacteria bacterium]|nr:glycosyltransferase family 39 protein [candidate division Zixibacteria bacterium]
MISKEKNASESRLVWPAAVFIAALVVRLIVLLEFLANDPSFYLPQLDSDWYHLWALRIAGGELLPTTVFIGAPLYATVLGLFYAVSGGSLLFAKIISIIIASFSCVLLYKIAERIFGQSIARIAGIMLALYGTVLFYDTQILPPVLTVFLILCAIHLLLKFEERKQLIYLCLSGLAFGLSLITEPMTAAAIPFILLWLLRYAKIRKGVSYRVTRGGLFIVILLMPVILTSYHNYQVAKQVIPVSNDCGLKFYLGNNPVADGLARRMPEIPAENQMPWHDLVFVTDSIAKFETGEQLSPGEISSYWKSKAVSWISSDVGGFFALTAKKSYYFLAGYESSDGTGIYDYRSYSMLLSALAFDFGMKIPFGLIMPLAIVGVIVTRKRWKELLPLHAMIWPFAAIAIFFTVNASVRLPVVPFVIMLAAAAVHTIWSLSKARKLKTIAVPCLVGIVLLIILNLNLFSLGKTNPFQYHFSRAIGLESSADTEGAIAEYREALKYYPSDARCHTRLGHLFFSIGKIDEAETHFISALQSDPYSPSANSSLGKVYLRKGNPEIARIYINDAFVKGRELPEVLVTWAELMEGIGEADSAEMFYKQALDKSTSISFHANLLGNYYVKTDQIDSAYKYFGIAVRNNEDYVTARVNLANVKLALGDTTAAVNDYTSILETNPDLIQVCFNLAAVHFMQRRPHEARRYVERCLTINPTYQPALQLLQMLDGK